MGSVLEIMDALAAALDDVLADSDVQVSGRMLINPTPPAVDIYPGGPLTDGELSGFGDPDGQLFFTVRARINTVDLDAAQDILLNMMDAQHELSVAAALMADQTADGSARSVEVDSPSGYTAYRTPDGGPLLGCEWKVSVVR